MEKKLYYTNKKLISKSIIYIIKLILILFFRLILQETIYQANQHEYLADIFAKEIYNSLIKKVRNKICIYIYWVLIAIHSKVNAYLR